MANLHHARLDRAPALERSLERVFARDHSRANVRNAVAAGPSRADHRRDAGRDVAGVFGIADVAIEAVCDLARLPAGGRDFFHSLGTEILITRASELRSS